MKRILIWGMTSNWGGIESVLYNYVVNTDTTKAKYDFITTFPTIPYEKELNHFGSKIYHLPNRKSDFFNYKKELLEFMERHAKEYDAVWLNDCMFGNIDIIKMAKKFGIKKRIVHAHNANSLGGGISRLIRHKINVLTIPFFATDYWACSQLAGKWTYSKKILKSNHYIVINNAIDSTSYKYDTEVRKKKRAELSISDDTVVIGHIGRFDYQKNHPYLIDIFEKILQRKNKIHLVCVGIGTDWNLIKNLAAKKRIESHISFLGQRKDVHELLQAFDLFILPSKFEGLPVVVVEALAAGLPCFLSDKITTEVSIIPELVSFQSIEKAPELWVDDIERKMKDFHRSDTQDKIIKAGFDIHDQAKKIIDLF